jgi:RimJ/RimL family protein N-acetyltransferase
MTSDLSGWTPRPFPAPDVLEGQYVRLEPLNPARHAEGLYAALVEEAEHEDYDYLFESPMDQAGFNAWLEAKAARKDILCHVAIDRQTGRIGGRQDFMRIDQTHGVIEIGSIHWGRSIAKSPVATEALFLHADHALHDLGYRRYEWKCHNRNEPSKRAALRFGFTFEGLFRHHMVAKGRNRDTAWFSIIDAEWPALRQAYLGWLAPENFDEQGHQRKSLAEFRANIKYLADNKDLADNRI